MHAAGTVVTMGPIFGFDRTSAFAETVSKNPAGANSSLFNLPDIIAVAGGVAIKHGNEIVAGLGAAAFCLLLDAIGVGPSLCFGRRGRPRGTAAHSHLIRETV